jgi:transposase
MAKRTDKKAEKDAVSTDEQVDVAALREEIKRLASNPETPPWVATLLTTVLLVLSVLLQRVETLERQLYGKKSEKMPRADKGPPQTPKRASHQDRRIRSSKLTEEEIVLPVSPDLKECPTCGAANFESLPAEESFAIEYIPGKLVRRRFLREKCICPQGCTIRSGPPAPRVGDSSGYGPELHAHVVVSRSLDAIPIHRVASQFARMGCAIDAHVLNACFHRVAAELMPLYEAMKKLLPQQGYINADETPQPVLAPNKTERAFMWTFVAQDFVVYSFSPSRSGETPKTLLAGGSGVVQAFAYSGYNAITRPDHWERAGCMAHLRRKFFDAKASSPEWSNHAMEQFHKLYLLERRAKEHGVAGTDAHRKIRQDEAKPLLEQFHAWMLTVKAEARPKSPIGTAIGYALKNWDALTFYLKYPHISIDNNIAELRLRIIALGRKNSMFVGSNEGGTNLAALMTLVTTAHINGLNPAQ